MAVCATPTKTVQHCNFRDYIKGARSGRAVSTRLDVIRAVAVSTAAFWALTPCSLVQKYCVRLYGGREGQSRFYPPPKKIGKFLQDYTVAHKDDTVLLQVR